MSRIINAAKSFWANDLAVVSATFMFVIFMMSYIMYNQHQLLSDAQFNSSVYRAEWKVTADKLKDIEDNAKRELAFADNQIKSLREELKQQMLKSFDNKPVVNDSFKPQSRGRLSLAALEAMFEKPNE